MAMKIYPDPQITALYKSQKANRAQAVEKTEPAKGTDQVQLSAPAQQREQALRAERIQELKAQIENGTYNPDLREVAAGLLKYIMQGK